MNTLNLSPSPHVWSRWSTQSIMLVVCLSLLPAAAVGVAVYGLHALWVILTSVLAAVGTEFLFDRFCRKPDTWKDGSAMVTGLMLALTLSPDVPLYEPVLGAVFAILVVKCCFGGLGKNFVNPALAGRCFLLISFSGSMTRFSVDGVAAATPVAELAAGKPVDLVRMFLGLSNGVIGSSILALLAGAALLLALRIIHVHICFSVLASFTLFMALFGGHGFDPGFLAAHLCGGGVVLGAFFMATDYVTSPVSRPGQVLYGLLIGVLGAMFRVYGSAADSFSYSIIISNLFVPLIDTFLLPKPYAFRRGILRRQRGRTSASLRMRIPRAGVVLTVIALLAGLSLSGVYSLTKGTIEAHRERIAQEAYQAVGPGATAFQPVPAAQELQGEPYGTRFGRVTVNDAVTGLDGAGKPVGYAVSVTSGEGYDGNVGLTVGITPEGAVQSISFTELHETPGKGMLCGDPAFQEQFSGRNVTSFTLLPGGGGTAPEEIDGIAGVTVTSRAVVNAVNAALDFYHTAIRGEASQ